MWCETMFVKMLTVCSIEADEVEFCTNNNKLLLTYYLFANYKNIQHVADNLYLLKNNIK